MGFSVFSAANRLQRSKHNTTPNTNTTKLKETKETQKNTNMSHPGSHGGLSNSSKGIFPPLPPDNQRRRLLPKEAGELVVKSRGVRDERVDDNPSSHPSVDSDNDDDIYEDGRMCGSLAIGFAYVEDRAV